MNSLPSSRHHDIDQQIDRALHSLRTALPTHADSTEIHDAFNAMTTRLVRNLRPHAAAAKPFHRWSRWANAGFAAAALCAACVVLLVLPARRTKNAALQQTASSVDAPHSITEAAAPRPFAGMTASALRLTPADHRGAVPSAAAAIDPAFLPSSPAPAEPLTRQEELLLSTVRRGTSAAFAQAENQSADSARVPSRPDSNPLFAGFRPEPPELEAQHAPEQVPESLDAVSALPANIPQLEIPNETNTEFRP